MIFERFGTDRTQALANYNPDLIARYCNHPERCMFGNAPTLADLNIAYGNATAKAFCIAQLNAINLVSGASRKMNDLQISFTSDALASRMTDEPAFKITEGLLFFWNFRLQKYGQFYGEVDPDVILRAFNAFLVERRTAYEDKRLEENRNADFTPEQFKRLQERQTRQRAEWLAQAQAQQEANLEKRRLTASNDTGQITTPKE